MGGGLICTTVTNKYKFPPHSMFLTAVTAIAAVTVAPVVAVLLLMLLLLLLLQFSFCRSVRPEFLQSFLYSS